MTRQQDLNLLSLRKKVTWTAAANINTLDTEVIVP